MPLIAPEYSNAVESAYKALNPVRIATGNKKATAFSNFIDKGLTAMGGVPNSKSGVPSLAQEYADTWSKHLPGELAAKKESIAEHNLLRSTLTQGGKHGVGGWKSGNCEQYGTDLGKLYKKHLPVELESIKEGKLKDVFVRKQIFFGSGTAPDYVTDTSGLT